MRTCARIGAAKKRERERERLICVTLVKANQRLLDWRLHQTLWQVSEVLFDQAGDRTHVGFRQKVNMLPSLQALLQGLHSPDIPIHSEQTLLMQSCTKARNHWIKRQQLIDELVAEYTDKERDANNCLWLMSFWCYRIERSGSPHYYKYYYSFLH